MLGTFSLSNLNHCIGGRNREAIGIQFSILQIENQLSGMAPVASSASESLWSVIFESVTYVGIDVQEFSAIQHILHCILPLV